MRRCRRRPRGPHRAAASLPAEAAPAPAERGRRQFRQEPTRILASRAPPGQTIGGAHAGSESIWHLVIYYSTVPRDGRRARRSQDRRSRPAQPHRRNPMPVLSRILTRILAAGAAGLALAALPAAAQTKLKWAHVYEVAEPYHTEALWAADENQINEGLGLATVDMIYTGVAFAGSIHKPIAITNAPYVLRDFEHWKAYRDAKLFRDIAKGYEDKTRHKVIALNYYGQRHVTANKEIKKPEDMKGMKLRVPPAPLFLRFTKSVGANATPIAFAEVYLALQQGTVDGQENPLPTIMAKK